MVGKTRIMYIESKSGGLQGDAVIGRISESKTGSTLRYNGKEFQSQKGSGFKSNYFDVATGAPYWISGPRKDGSDGLYGYRPVPIDEDSREEYWVNIRRRPDLKLKSTT
jgi:hypothetical protein